MALFRDTIVVLACALAITAAELHPLSDAFIDFINSKQTTWKAGRNFPENTPISHIKKLLGVLPYKEVPPLPSFKHDADVIAELPANFDARKKWPNCPSLSEIRDQGSCGSCWAVATVEAMTDRFCIFSNGTKQFHFSAEDLITCCDECGFGCHGGNPAKAWMYWNRSGLVSGGNYNSSQGCRSYSTPPCVHHAPGHKVNDTGDIMACFDSYRDTPKCSKTCDKSYDLDYEQDKHYGKKSIYVFDEEDHIMSEVFLHGSVVAVFEVYFDFYTYKSGVYFPVEGIKFIGFHAVKIIGWGVENGVKYWLAANSWNSHWGDNGFFKVGRGNNTCLIEYFVTAGEPLITEE